MVGDTAPKRWRIAVDALAVLTAVAIILSGWALYTRFNDSNAARKRNAQIWHAVICDIEQKVVKSKTIPLQKKRDDLVFYDRLLVVDAHAAPCGIKLPRRART